MPFEAMILATADVYDALSADRPYRDAMPYEQAMGILTAGIGTAHNGVFVDALARGIARFAEIGTQSAELPLSEIAEDSVALRHAS